MRDKKGLRYFLALLLIVLSLMGLTACEDDELKPTEQFYVNDFSNVLSEKAENEIFNEGKQLNETKETKGAQVVVVTTDSTDGDDIAEYSVELGRSWGIGSDEENNGVLILVATEDRNVYIATGYGLEGALPDSKVGRILDNYAIPDFKNDNFEQGILKTYKAVVNEVYMEYGITPENYVSPESLPEKQDDSGEATKVMYSWLILLAVVIVYFMIFGRRGIFFPIGYGGHYHSGGFGGFSGGGGGFSGGGGSFGGGGAGRGF